MPPLSQPTVPLESSVPATGPLLSPMANLVMSSTSAEGPPEGESPAPEPPAQIQGQPLLSPMANLVMSST